MRKPGNVMKGLAIFRLEVLSPRIGQVQRGNVLGYLLEQLVDGRIFKWWCCFLIRVKKFLDDALVNKAIYCIHGNYFPGCHNLGDPWNIEKSRHHKFASHCSYMACRTSH